LPYVPPYYDGDPGGSGGDGNDQSGDQSGKKTDEKKPDEKILPPSSDPDDIQKAVDNAKVQDSKNQNWKDSNSANSELEDVIKKVFSDPQQFTSTEEVEKNRELLT
jgi:hypothetical protein